MHLSRDQEEAEEDEETEKANQFKTPKCQICKQAGHKAADCDKDPNIRTLYDVDEETRRVEKVLVKKKEQFDNYRVTMSLLEKTALLSNEHLTNRVLSHDDFNYSSINDRIFALDLPVVTNFSDDESDE